MESVAKEDPSILPVCDSEQSGPKQSRRGVRGERNCKKARSLRRSMGTNSPYQIHLEVDISNITNHFYVKNQNKQIMDDIYKFVSDLPVANKQMLCSFHGPSISDWSHVGRNASHIDLRLVCEEPAPKASPPTPRPAVTSPEPSGHPRFLLVEGKERLRCAGVVEFYRGSTGGSICYDSKAWSPALGNLICQSLNCGTFLDHLDPSAGRPDSRNPEGLKALQVLWEVKDPDSSSLDQIFRKEKSCRGNQTISIICSEFQPKVRSRLKGGSSPCSGIVEVNFEGQWRPLCRTKKNWDQVCHEQHCGEPISLQDVPQKSLTAERAGMLHCAHENLSHCYSFQPGDPLCKGIRIECRDLNAAGLGAGTVISIILALILLAVLLVACGPLAYKKLEKKFLQKKQRQWIGPTGVNQNVSFHRNHTVTVRSQAENPGASNVENEYSQAPRHSRLSAYPALEGALNRASNPPDNSSDSDYDLHGAQRL
ncbi:T-cell surface glycoprotein CD5 [Gracilinanus agilis]|uniref:T-cell surface glycoprotein CD5 n=1 Tax=Gracilinanus agilis TaxID=191870 RepID=UPI001CFE1D00|nr:T-cell surface glycoprotein CD5 [Gracilinanus agilis]